MVAVIDIGAGGILFYYNRSIEVGTALDLKVNYSAEKDPVICEGKVIRVLPVPGGEFSLVAVVFEDIDEKERKSLDEVIELVAVNKANAGK
jgi:hypothetical protein